MSSSEKSTARCKSVIRKPVGIEAYIQNLEIPRVATVWFLTMGNVIISHPFISTISEKIRIEK
jgi:hypothetical protein